MFRKVKQFLLHMWHPSCYSIKSFDQRKDRNQDQGNVFNGLQSRNSAINISEGYILPYWKELSTQQLLSLFIRKNLSNKNQDIFLLMSKTNQKKSENDYKCCKLEIYKLTPSFRNSRLSSSERLCWIVWSITRSFTLIYPYPVFLFILKYLLCHK